MSGLNYLLYKSKVRFHLLTVVIIVGMTRFYLNDGLFVPGHTGWDDEYLTELLRTDSDTVAKSTTVHRIQPKRTNRTLSSKPTPCIVHSRIEEDRKDTS